jgi:hypothetical protein
MLCKEQECICGKSTLFEGIMQMIDFDSEASHNHIISIHHIERVLSLSCICLSFFRQNAPQKSGTTIPQSFSMVSLQRFSSAPSGSIWQ